MLIEGLSLWWIKRPLFQVWRPVHTQSLLHGREIQKVPRGRNHQVCGGVLWRERHACDGPIREVCLETSRQLGVAQEVKLTRECWAVVGVSLCPNPAFLHGCGRYRGVGPDPGCGCGWFGCQLLHLHKSACELFFFFFFVCVTHLSTLVRYLLCSQSPQVWNCVYMKCILGSFPVVLSVSPLTLSPRLHAQGFTCASGFCCGWSHRFYKGHHHTYVVQMSHTPHVLWDVWFSKAVWRSALVNDTQWNHFSKLFLFVCLFALFFFI